MITYSDDISHLLPLNSCSECPSYPPVHRHHRETETAQSCTLQNYLNNSLGITAHHVYYIKHKA